MIATDCGMGGSMLVIQSSTLADLIAKIERLEKQAETDLDTINQLTRCNEHQFRRLQRIRECLTGAQ